MLSDDNRVENLRLLYDKPIADFFSINNSYGNILVTLVLNIDVEKIDI